MEIFEDYYDEADAVSQVNTETAKNLSGLVRNLRKVEDFDRYNPGSNG